MQRLEKLDSEYVSARIDFEGQFIYNILLDDSSDGISFPLFGDTVYLYISRSNSDESWESYTECYRYGKPKRKNDNNDYVYCLRKADHGNL